MRIKLFKSRTIKKVLTLLGFTSTAFIFAACYGPLPDKYREDVYADSIQNAFEEEDTLIVEVPTEEVVDSIQ